MSKSRENKTFSGLELDGNLKSSDAEPRCGIQVIDLRSGDVVHWLRIEGVVLKADTSLLLWLTEIEFKNPRQVSLFC